MDIILIVVILAVVFGFGAGPWWGWHHYGYTPSSVLLFIAVIALVVYFVRRNDSRI